MLPWRPRGSGDTNANNAGQAKETDQQVVTWVHRLPSIDSVPPYEHSSPDVPSPASHAPAGDTSSCIRDRRNAPGEHRGPRFLQSHRSDAAHHAALRAVVRVGVRAGVSLPAGRGLHCGGACGC